MQISERAINEIRFNNKAMGLLCAEFDKHMVTIKRWLNDKNPMLTTPNAVRVIKDATGLTDEEILVPESVKATA